ncbi:MAG: ArsR/SmtB family transcription factor, partial [Thermovirgaceae bacterium]
ISPAAVSQHLRTMRESGIVIPEKQGYFVHYRIDEARLRQWETVAHDILGANGIVKDTEEGEPHE